MRIYKTRISAEALLWIVGLVAVTLLSALPQFNVTLCISKLCGFGECLGCGLGASVGQAVRGNLEASWHLHPLGIPAIVILGARIIHLLRNQRNNERS